MAAAALVVLVWLGGAAWRPTAIVTLLAGAYGVVFGRWSNAALAPGLVAMLLVPGLLIVLSGTFWWPTHSIWLALLLGAAAGTWRAHWSCPAIIRIPLAMWTLTVALTAVIVVAREADFTTQTLHGFSVQNSGVPAALIVQWVALTAAALLIGVLWFDYLYATYTSQPAAFVTCVVLPFAGGWLLNVIAAIYQWKVDPSYASPGFWAAIGRAPGMVHDANAFGALAALWWPALAALAARQRSRAVGVLLAVCVALLGWAGVWASGSRGAFLLALTGTFVISLSCIASVKRGRWVAALLLLTALSSAIWLGFHYGQGTGTVERFAQMARQSGSSVDEVIISLWNRDGYGTIAGKIIRQHPVAGVGPGLFHTRVTDHPIDTQGNLLPPDNAQNWYRHQVAELGIAGSPGWALWVVTMVWALLMWRRARATADLTALRWSLIAFGLVSTVAMPGQDPFVAITFWTLAFWYLSGVRQPSPGIGRALAHPAAWVVVWTMALANAAIVGAQASRSMRPPFRAAALDQAYQYGVRVEDPVVVQTAARAVIVPRATGRWLKLTYWVEHPDADANRVHVEIRVDARRVGSRRMSRNVPVTEYVEVQDGKRFVLEVTVDRTFREPNSGRPRGLSMEWEFVPRGPVS